MYLLLQLSLWALLEKVTALKRTCFSYLRAVTWSLKTAVHTVPEKITFFLCSVVCFLNSVSALTYIIDIVALAWSPLWTSTWFVNTHPTGDDGDGQGFKSPLYVLFTHWPPFKSEPEQ